MVRRDFIKTIGVGSCSFVLGFIIPFMMQVSVTSQPSMVPVNETVNKKELKEDKAKSLASAASESRISELWALIKQKEETYNTLISQNNQLKKEYEKIQNEFGSIVIPNGVAQAGVEMGSAIREGYLLKKKYGDNPPKQGEPGYEEYANEVTDLFARISRVQLGLLGEPNMSGEKNLELLYSALSSSLGCDEAQKSKMKELIIQSGIGDNTKSKEDRTKSLQNTFSDMKKILSEDQVKQLEATFKETPEGGFNFGAFSL